MSDVVIRPASLADINQILMIEESAWPDGCQACETQLRSRIEIFQAGNLVAATPDGAVFAYVSSLIVAAKSAAESWEQITSGGMITGHVDGYGTEYVLYGVDFSAMPVASGAAKRLLIELARLSVSRRLIGCRLGARPIMYHKHADLLSCEEYIKLSRNRVRKVEINGRAITEDPEIALYKRVGLKVGEVIPNYFPDPQSLNYGVTMDWPNPFRRLPLPGLWATLVNTLVVAEGWRGLLSN